MNLQPNLKLAIVAGTFLTLGFLAGRWNRSSNDEASSVYATYGSATVRGSEVLPRIQSELQQLEQSKYALKKRASDELLLERLPAAEKAELEALKAYESARPMIDGAPEATGEEVKAYVTKMKYDPAKLGPAGLEGIKQKLSAEKTKAYEETQKLALAKSVSMKRVHYGIPRVRAAQIEVLKPKAAMDGPSGAPIDFVVIGNFNCPTCAAAHRRLAELKYRYPEKLKISFLFHTGDGEDSLAHMTGEAALCANEQNQFWKYYELLFEKRLDSERDLLLTAHTAKLNTDDFEKCFRERRYKPRIAEEIKWADKVGVTSPSFIINGEPVTATESLGVLSNIIDSEL